MMFTINEYREVSQIFDDAADMIKEGAAEAEFRFQGLAPLSITIPEEWMKRNPESIPYLVDLVFRLAKVFGDWGNRHTGNHQMPEPPQVIDEILAQKEVKIHRYDFSGSPFVMTALERILMALKVKHTVENENQSDEAVER